MRADFDLKNVKIEPCGDDYAFVVGKYTDEDDNDCYLRVDVPMKSDPEWHFWMLFEDSDGCAETASWDMTQPEMEYVMSRVKAYLCDNGYLLVNGHYVSAGEFQTETKKKTEKEELLRHLKRAVKLCMSAGVSDEEIIAAVKEAKEEPECLRGLNAK